MTLKNARARGCPAPNAGGADETEPIRQAQGPEPAEGLALPDHDFRLWRAGPGGGRFGGAENTFDIVNA